MMSYKQYEKFTNESFRVNRAYVRIAGDLVSGILLGQIVYWNLPNKDGKSKLRVFKEGQYWLAKERSAWQEEVCITPKQYDRAIKVLIDKGLVVAKKFKFNGSPTVHIRLNEVELDRLLESELTRGENGTSPKVKKEIDERVISLTESTSENTSESTTIDPVVVVIKFYQQNIAFSPSPFELEAIQQDAEEWGSDIIIHAMKIAIKQNIKTYRYVEGILKRWRNEGIKTMEQIEAKENQQQASSQVAASSLPAYEPDHIEEATFKWSKN